jgi:acyl-CoA thioesterase FadM
MASYVAVVGSGPRAAQWATRFLAAGLDVVVDDRTVVEVVRDSWPAAQRLGLFPGADPSRLTVSDDAEHLARARLVQVVGNATAPPGARLVATDQTAFAHQPIHLVPLVELAAGPHSDELVEFYTSIGMTPCLPDADPHLRRQLGPALVELTDGDPDSIIAVMRALRPSGKGSGAAIAAHEARRFATGAPRPWVEGDTVAAPLALYDTRVEPEWVDYNGHMTEAAYLTAAGWASDALFRYIGDDETYRAAGHSFYTVETHIHYVLEVDVHEPLHFTTQLLGVDAKRMHLVHEMFHGDTGKLLCTIEQMLVHVDMTAGRSTTILPHVASALGAIAHAHAALPVPPQVGSVMRLPRPRA